MSYALPDRFAAAIVALILVTSLSSHSTAAAPRSVAPPGGVAGASAIAHARKQAETTYAEPAPDSVRVARSARVRVAVRRGGVDGLKLHAPYISQMDGTPFAGGNCGPAALAMALGSYGHVETINALRESINGQTGDWSTESGTSWRALQSAAEARGFKVSSPFGPDGAPRRWTLDEVLVEASQGRPTLVLVKYQALPGHERSSWYGDHYVTVLGATEDGRVVYHDSAFRGVSGAYRTLDRERFSNAWSTTWAGQNWTAMVLVGR